jgi:glucosamine--fructose-6-phosphate aminotransferase (isomerizing)
MSLKSEIFSQPDVLAKLVNGSMETMRDIQREIGKRDVNYIFLAARGTSDNAGLYAKYLWGSYNQLPIALAAPSLFSIYEKPPSLKGALVLGISQSGQSPDIIRVIIEGRRQGVPTLVITNDPESTLAEEAEFVFDMGAGPEEAVAATKTYTAQLMAIAMFSVAMDGDERRINDLMRVADLVEQVLDLDKTIEQVAERYRYMTQCVVLGRGYNYATAFEWSLKLKELAYVVAAPYSPADFQHGPVAILSYGFPILSIAPKGAVFSNIVELLSQLVAEREVELVAISNDERALQLSRTPLRIPGNLPEWLSPIVSIVPAQLFSYYLTRTKGYDTERPRGLQKVTLTR